MARKRGRPSETDMEVKAKAPKPLVKSSGSPYLDKVRDEIMKAYNPEYVTKKVGELMNAHDEKPLKGGGTVVTPNWKAQGEGLKVLLNIVGLEKAGEEASSGSRAPTHITVNVLGGQDVKVEAKQGDKVVDVKPIEPSPEDIKLEDIGSLPVWQGDETAKALGELPPEAA